MKTALLAFGTLVNADRFHVGPTHRGADKNISWNASSVTKNGRETNIKFAILEEYMHKNKTPKKYRALKLRLDNADKETIGKEVVERPLQFHLEDILRIEDKAEMTKRITEARDIMNKRANKLMKDENPPLYKEYGQYLRKEFDDFERLGGLFFKRTRETSSFQASNVTRVTLKPLADQHTAEPETKTYRALPALAPLTHITDSNGNPVAVLEPKPEEHKKLDLELSRVVADAYEIVFYKQTGWWVFKKEVECGKIQFRTVEQTSHASKLLKFICNNRRLGHFKKNLHSELNKINSKVQRTLELKEQATKLQHYLKPQVSPDGTVLKDAVLTYDRAIQYYWKNVERDQSGHIVFDDEE